MQRFRSRVISEQYGWCDFSNTVPGGPADSSYGPFPTNVETESMEDVVVPEYHKKIAQGAIINNPCSYGHSSTKTLGSGTLKSTSLTSNPNGDYYLLEGLVTSLYVNAGDCGYLPNPDVSVTSDAKLRAIAAIDTTPFAFGEDLLEVGETIKFLRKPLGSILKLTTAFVKQVRRHPRYRTDLARAIADNWLTFRFAFSPLVLSAFSAVEAYGLKQATLPPRLTARGFDYGTASDSDFEPGLSGGRVFERTSEATLKNHAQILYQVSNPVYDWRWRLGLRTKDIPAAVWAIMPYSFMVDRVFDVSRFITGVSNLSDPNVVILSGSYTTRSEITKTIRLQSAYESGWSKICNGETIESKSFGYTRTPWQPSVLDTIPSVYPKGLAESVTELADVAALLNRNLRFLPF